MGSRKRYATAAARRGASPTAPSPAAPRLVSSFAGIALVAAASLALFWRATSFPFLNWDDTLVFVSNQGLQAGNLAVWSFTTTYMEHYQPLSWLTWGAAARGFGLSPSVMHGLNVVFHAGCAALVYVLAARLLPADAEVQRPAAAVAALLFALHPMRVETVAWTSAMPYTLALLLALASTLAWVDGRRLFSFALFVLSLLARPIALGLPVVFLVLSFYRRNAEAKPLRSVVASLVPHAGAAMLAALLEGSARLAVGLAEIGVAARLTLAAHAPLHYLGLTLFPATHNPVDILPAYGYAATGLDALAALVFPVTVTAGLLWAARSGIRGPLVTWLCYLVLLLPAAGLFLSGVQARADRYSYFPAVPIAIALAWGIARVATVAASAGRHVRPPAVTLLAAAPIVALLAVQSSRQLDVWSDSVTFWTAVVSAEPRSDIALYNLADALRSAGRRDEALARYEELLAVAPTHADGRANYRALKAISLEEQANAFAGAGRLADAVQHYQQALEHDPRRAHARAGLGMALAQQGRLDDARPHLEATVASGAYEPVVANTLAFIYAQRGERERAVALLRAASERHPGDAGIAGNLAMLLR